MIKSTEIASKDMINIVCTFVTSSYIGTKVHRVITFWRCAHTTYTCLPLTHTRIQAQGTCIAKRCAVSHVQSVELCHPRFIVSLFRCFVISLCRLFVAPFAQLSRFIVVFIAFSYAVA